MLTEIIYQSIKFYRFFIKNSYFFGIVVISRLEYTHLQSGLWWSNFFLEASLNNYCWDKKTGTFIFKEVKLGDFFITYAESFIGTEDPSFWGEAFLRRVTLPDPNPTANSGGDERRKKSE